MVNHDLLDLASTTMPTLRNGGSVANDGNTGASVSGKAGTGVRGGRGCQRGSAARGGIRCRISGAVVARLERRSEEWRRGEWHWIWPLPPIVRPPF